MRYVLSLLIVFLMCAPAFAEDEILFKNAGLSRMVSGAAEIIKTTKLDAGNAHMLDGPSVEFMLEIEHKGALVTLVPSDFKIKETKVLTRNREVQTCVRLDSHYDGLPLTIYLNYYREPQNTHLQKSVTVLPCKEAPDSVLKHVLIDDLRFREQYVPCTPTGQPGERFRFDATSNFAMIDPKSGRGLFFFVASPRGKERFTTGHSLAMSEDMDAPLGKGFETARATIGAVTGSPELIYKRFREFIWDNYCVARRGTTDKPEVVTAADYHSAASLAHRLDTASYVKFDADAAGDCLQARKRLFSAGFILPRPVIAADGCTPGPEIELIKQRLPQLADAYQHVLALPDGQSVDGEGRIVDNKGFLLLHNPSDKPRKITLPLAEPELELKGNLKLTDWARLDAPSALGTVKPTDTVEIEIPPLMTRMIGINVEP